MPRIKVKGGFFVVPMSNGFKKQHGEVRIPFPERLVDKKVKEVRIHPRFNARFFDVEFVYELPMEEQPVDST